MNQQHLSNLYMALPHSLNAPPFGSTRDRSTQRQLHKSWRWVRRLVYLVLLLPMPLFADDAWFEVFKSEATPTQLHQFLYAMPKGGDLHNHLTGSVHPEWFLQAALASKRHGYTYYAKVKINNCRVGSNEFGPNAYFLLFRTIPQLDYDALPECERSEYIPLSDLEGETKAAWLNALRLDQDHEGRSEFFEAHWPRLGGFTSNPYLIADVLFENIRSFGAEGLSYLETQTLVHGFKSPTGEPISPEAVADIYRARLAQKDAKATGVEVRFQLSLLRFSPNAEEALEVLYRFVASHPDFVGVNMVGREDNDKGYPLRFLETYRKLRRQISGVHLAIHAGEVDEPNRHIRDTLLLGAERIGHGVNLISDPEMMILMRDNRYLVEINLISNLLLEYVSDYSQHPFPEYLRIGIPVALSTDDRGMWDSTMTDEFFVAVTEFNLSWQEVKKLSLNSLAHSFLDEATKTRLVNQLRDRLKAFEARFKRRGLSAVAAKEPEYRGFLCRRYQVCDPGTNASATP